MPLRQDDIDAVCNMSVPVDFDHCDIIEDVRIITMIDRMGIFQKSNLFFLNVHIGIGALIVVFAVVIVQMGMNNNVDVLRRQAQSL